MVKRKVAATEMETPLPQKKKKVSVSSSDSTGKLDCSKPLTLMKALLGGTTIEDFIKTYWEKKPLVVKRSDPTFYGELFSLDTLKEVMKNNELEFESDIDVCRVVNNEKEILNGEEKITAKELERLLKKEKGTVQFHHPQRYVDELWNMVEKLETYFSCLVGSSAYITPPCSQGVLPHSDDLDLFHLQLEGSQRWKVYKPMVELSRDYNQDLPLESIGKPMLEVVLGQGDLLYFPRGMIYQSENDDKNGHSVYLSVSTYQQHTYGDFLTHAVQQAIEKGLEDDVNIRSGLPIDCLSILGSGKCLSSYISDEALENDEKYSNLKKADVIAFKEKIKAQIANLIDHVDVNTASDAMCVDFFGSRLPPFEYVKKETAEEVKESDLPTLKSKIKIRFPEHVRIVYEGDDDEDDDSSDESSGDEEMEEEEEKTEKDGKKSESKQKVGKPTDKKDPKNSSKSVESKGKVSDASSKSQKKSGKSKAEEEEHDDEGEDDEDEADIEDNEPYIKILHTLNNDREWHMSSDENQNEEGCIRLHLTFGKAAVDLLNDSDKFTSVGDLSLEDDEDKLTLATTLFEHDLIEMK